LKWNMGWMHDMLDYLAMDPIFRKYHHGKITFSLMYAFNENYLLPLSHDEVVHLKKSLLNKMPGDGWQQFANLRAFFGYMYTHPGKKLLFQGGEFGMRSEWSEARSIDWHELQHESHQKLHRYVRDLLHLYTREPALWQVDDSWAGFEWLSANDNENSVIAFVRRARDPDDLLVVVCNFTPNPRHGYTLAAPRAGFYRELLNSDAESYWGSNLGNLGGVQAAPADWSSSGYVLALTLPPLSTLILKPDPRPRGPDAPAAADTARPAGDAAADAGVPAGAAEIGAPVPRAGEIPPVLGKILHPGDEPNPPPLP
ncbi:MAG TPA: alpha amylase C-terminal domain-containing protein, partial [Chloroflexia bacterium]|nr:alpha amylase C-terminal domain-containing protein [Chloroflexia bacterium]